MPDPYDAALAQAGGLLGQPLGPAEPESGHDFRGFAMLHTLGATWARTQLLDTRSRSLISVTMAAVPRDA
jgi:4-carboxymuconolactone decarboxylase